MWTPALDRASPEPVFRQIVQRLVDDVATGRLAAGTRLPPHRDLADTLCIARGTVARAYREAEKLGLLRGAIGRGTEVVAPDAGTRPYSSLLTPPTVVRDLGTNLPLRGIDPDPAGVLREIADRPDRMSLLRYHPPEGLPRHRMAGLRWLKKTGISATLDEVIVCAGAQHALYVTISLLARRVHALYVEELTYPGVRAIAEALDLPLVPVAMDAEGMTATGLERAARRHGRGIAYLMPTIHNPTGGVLSLARRASLAAVARARDLVLVEDEANRMFLPRPPPPLRSFAPERTFLVASVSKVLSPGLRVAFVLAPESERAALVRRVWATEWMVGPLGPEMVTEWLDQGVVDRTLARKRAEAARRQRIARQVFGRASLEAHPHALHVWLALRGGWGGERLAAEATAAGIVVTPSSAFWARPTAPPRRVRIALGGVDDVRDFERGLRKIAAILAGGPS